MVFSKTDYKQFMTEIKFIGRQKEFSGFSKGFKNREQIKDAYDYMFINVCRKYDLDTDDICDELDKAWDNKKFIKFNLAIAVAGAPLMEAIDQGEKIHKYIVETHKIAEKYAEKALNDNE